MNHASKSSIVFISADNPNSEMFKKLGKYLDLLHFCILFWTKKELSCQAALVENGLIYLILNELHTAPTAPVSTQTTRLIGPFISSLIIS